MWFGKSLIHGVYILFDQYEDAHKSVQFYRNMSSALPLANHELLGLVVPTYHQNTTSQSSGGEMQMSPKKIGTKMLFTFSSKKGRSVLATVATLANQARSWWQKMSIPWS